MSSSDRLEIRGLRVLGTHGVLAEEQERAQPFEVDLDVVLDLRLAARSDRLADTVNYAALIERVVTVVATTRLQLLEGLAAAIAETVLEDRGVLRVSVCVRKLRPPLPADVTTVGVRIERGRAEHDAVDE